MQQCNVCVFVVYEQHDTLNIANAHEGRQIEYRYRKPTGEVLEYWRQHAPVLCDKEPFHVGVVAEVFTLSCITIAVIR
jgi:hypothetical protein